MNNKNNLQNIDYSKYIGKKYKMNDLSSVYTHYDTETGRNVATENKLKNGDDTNGESSK